MKYIFFVLLLIASYCQADEYCQQHLNDIIYRLYPKLDIQQLVNRDSYIELHDSQHQILSFPVCKVWPANPKLAIVSFAALQTKDDKKQEYDESTELFDLHIVMISTANNSVAQHLTEKNSITSDGIALAGINIDTAKYQLDKDTLAFGIRYHLKNASRLYPYEATALNLYTNQNNKIKNILSDLIVREYSGEYDGNCEGYFSSVKRIIMMSKVNKATEMAALMVKTKKETQENTVLPHNDCQYKTTTHKPTIVKMDFNGEQYPVPKNMRIVE